MRGLAAAAVVMSCGGRAPEPLPPLQPPRVHPVEHRPEPLVRVPRPELPDIAALIPDLTEQLRWPLSIMEHPALEPRYPVARVLAATGISWSELCARGVQNRRDPAHKDELAYLGAWCAAQAHDTAAAVRALAPLSHAANLELAAAVPYDLVNVLVAEVDVGHADQLLTGESLRDPRLWDLLAAAYFEVGKNSDSFEASSTAAQLDGSARMDARCHRLARLAMIGSEGQRSVFVDELADAAKQKNPDPTCVELALSVPCVLAPAERCEPYLRSQHYVPWRAQIVSVYETWPERASWKHWLDYAWKARHAWPADGGIELVNDALEAAVGASDCSAKQLEGLSRGADAIAVGIEALEPKAAWVRAMLVDERACRDFRDHWVQSHP